MMIKGENLDNLKNNNEKKKKKKIKTEDDVNPTKTSQWFPS